MRSCRRSSGSPAGTRAAKLRRALLDGRVEAWRARLVATGTRKLDQLPCAEVESELLPRVDRVTSGRVARLVQSALCTHAPEIAADEARAAECARDVPFGESDNQGNKDLAATMSAAEAVRLEARVEFVADLLAEEARLSGQELRTPRGALRTRALALLADPSVVTALFSRVRALRSGTAPAEPSRDELPTTVVHLHMRRDELLEEVPGAATVEGTRRLRAAPVPFEAIEEVLDHSHVVVKPVADLDHMAPGGGYAFTGDPHEAVVLKSTSCVFPFCDRPARICDNDHVEAAPDGPTTVENGAPLCRRHHRVKTHGRWRLRQPLNGIFLWVSPTGRIYLVDDRATTRLSDAA